MLLEEKAGGGLMILKNSLNCNVVIWLHLRGL